MKQFSRSTAAVCEVIDRCVSNYSGTNSLLVIWIVMIFGKKKHLVLCRCLSYVTYHQMVQSVFRLGDTLDASESSRFVIACLHVHRICLSAL